MRILQRKKEDRNPKINQLLRECDESAARHWQLAARSREQGYKEWLKQVKKTADFIRLLKG